MKKTLVILLLLNSINITIAQETKAAHSISFYTGYFGHFIAQPGVQLGSTFNLHLLQKEKGLKSNVIIMQPEFSYYTLKDKHSSFFFNPNFGLKTPYKKRLYSIYAIGLGYNLENRIQDLSYSVGTGEYDKNTAFYSFFVPNVNYTLGKNLNENFAWYVKIYYGMKFSTKIINTTFVALSIGINITTKH